MLCGDANGDNVLSVADAIMVLRHIVGLTVLDENSIQRAATEDDDLTVKDAIKILRRVAGLEKKVYRLF